MNQPAFLTGALAPVLPSVARHGRPHCAIGPGGIYMGRRSEKIKGRKEAQTKARTKVFARVGKMITMAVKAGGADTIANKALADALDAAKAVSFPKDTIEKAIARASNTDQADFKESSFEVYGHGGVGIFVDILTDNVNRASADIRTVVNKNKMKIASPGSVAFNFDRRGVVRVEAEHVDDEDSLLTAAMEGGADECEQDPADESVFRVITQPSGLADARRAVQDAGYSIVSAQIEMVPKTLVSIEGDDAERNLRGIELLEELDDVDAVYCNMAT